jgi:hypothetical protein
MIKKLEKSSGNVFGYKVMGFIDRQDYDVLEKDADSVLEKHENMKLLLQFDKFMFEFMSAWGKDMGFGMKYGEKIEKLAIVGEKKWQKLLAKFSAPIFGKESKFFHTDDIDLAWDWLEK